MRFAAAEADDDDDDDNNDADSSSDAGGEGWGSLVALHSETSWLPLRREGHCVPDRDGALASRVTAADLFRTYRECCREFDDEEACRDVSEALAGPTAPPAAGGSGGGTADDGGGGLAAYFWPRYTDVPGRCRRDGDAAPAYMRRDPTAYLFPTAHEVRRRVRLSLRGPTGCVFVMCQGSVSDSLPGSRLKIACLRAGLSLRGQCMGLNVLFMDIKYPLWRRLCRPKSRQPSAPFHCDFYNSTTIGC